MRKINSLGSRLIALALSLIMVLGMVPGQVFALEAPQPVAQIGETPYYSIEEALAAVPTGDQQTAPEEATTIKLLADTKAFLDVGKSDGSVTMNLVLDLGEHTLTLGPGVGSAGTASNGIRVLAYSKLKIMNGTLLCSDIAEDNIKVGIANYGELELEDVTLTPGAKTIYTINNRGALTLEGKTKVTSGTTCAITNDPYDLYYTTDVNASVTCNSSEVVVGSMLVERYERDSANKGGVELNISAGYFGKIVEDGSAAVSASYSVTGGTIGVSTTEELEFALGMVKAGAEYDCPQQPVTIQLLNNLEGSFDVGTSTGKAPKNILLDLNEKTLTLKPGIGSFNTKSNGIRVLAYSKLKIMNGKLVCSSEESDNIKVGIANYSDLELEDVAVKSGDQTIYTINNRGSLTLTGNTSVENGQVDPEDYEGGATAVAITNDPYNLYYTTPINAEINCSDSTVSVGNVQLETYGSKGDIVLNISAGTFGAVSQPETEGGTVQVDGNITGGSFASNVSDYCKDGFGTASGGTDGPVTVKQSQTDFGFEKPTPDAITYDPENKTFTNAVQNAQGAVTYAIVDGEDLVQETSVASIDQNGKLTIKTAGTVTVKATAAATGEYNSAVATYTLEIKKAPQPEFAFATPTPVDQWIGVTYTNAASGGLGTGEVTYTITEGNAYATINETTGELTFNTANGPGTVTVKATKAADDCYQSAEAVYTVTSKTIDQTGLAFATTGPVNKTYAENGTYTNVASGGEGTGAVTYESSDSTVATVNNEGVVTFQKAGTVTITATKAADDKYNRATATNTLTIEKADQTFEFVNDSDTVT